LNEQVKETNSLKKQLRELKKTNFDLQANDKALFLQDVATQCDREW
jgi:hypothetical protein